MSEPIRSEMESPRRLEASFRLLVESLDCTNNMLTSGIGSVKECHKFVKKEMFP
jgi:hypothetical protein